MDRNALVGAVRDRLVRLPEPYANCWGVVPAPPPVDPPDLRPALRRLEAATRALERVQTIVAEMHSPYLISRVLPRKEAVSSSAMEGTYSTLDELLSEEEAEETSERTGQVRDYALALEALLPEASTAGRAIFTADLVERLHRDLMKGDSTYEDVPGETRTRVAWIGGSREISRSIFNPPPPDAVKPCLRDALDYMRCDDDQDRSQSLITRMAIAHAHFEAVHPFRDGNGRVGRLLLPLMMAAEGIVPVYLSPYIEAHKGAYGAALKAAQQRLEWHEIVGFLSDAIVGTVDDMLTMRTALDDLRHEWEARRRFRRGSAALHALDILASYPVLTVNRLRDLLGISFPSAATAVEQLVDARILAERTGYTRNRVFVAKEVLSIVNGRE